VIAGAQSDGIRDKQIVFDRFLPMSKQNAASLFKNTLGALLTERDWNPNYPENILFVWIINLLAAAALES